MARSGKFVRGLNLRREVQSIEGRNGLIRGEAEKLILEDGEDSEKEPKTTL